MNFFALLAKANDLKNQAFEKTQRAVEAFREMTADKPPAVVDPVALALRGVKGELEYITHQLKVLQRHSDLQDQRLESLDNRLVAVANRPQQQISMGGGAADIKVRMPNHRRPGHLQ